VPRPRSLVGIFAKTFVRKTLEENLAAVTAHGFSCVQYNMACAGVPTLPDRYDRELSNRIEQALDHYQVLASAVSGTFNMIHPDPRVRDQGIEGLRHLAPMEWGMITLCTGTRDPENMWRRHPDNDSPEAWADLCAALREALYWMEDTDTLLGIEPEPGNVIDSARKARRLLDEMGSPLLKIVFDPANLVGPGQLPRMHEILDEAFDLLGKDILLAHAKDVAPDDSGRHVPAGKGALDYDYFLKRLLRVYVGPIILHGLEEHEVPECKAFLEQKTASLKES
jgi:sugar phosphate isomerase/epimerase